MTGIELIAQERARQIEQEGWTPEHDAQWRLQELAGAAACYALPPSMRSRIDIPFPFHKSWWKPTPDNRIRELAKAGALIAAEIDRLQREAENV